VKLRFCFGRFGDAAVQPLCLFDTAASSGRSKRSTALLRSSRLKEVNWGTSNFGDRRYLGWVLEGLRRVVEHDGTYALRESSEAYGGEFAQESKALRRENTIPCQKFTEETRLSLVRSVTVCSYWDLAGL
jgi:hypothetical protein